MNLYVEYKTLITSLQNLLGLSCINLWDTDALHPYVMEVLRYLVEKLTLSDSGDIYANMKTLCSEIDDVNEILLEEGNMPNTYYKVGLTDTVNDSESWSDALWCVAWANITTSLWESLKCNYASILWDLEHQECACHCGCSGSDQEADSDDNLYSKLVGNGSSLSGCGCTGGN